MPVPPCWRESDASFGFDRISIPVQSHCDSEGKVLSYEEFLHGSVYEPGPGSWTRTSVPSAGFFDPALVAVDAAEFTEDLKQTAEKKALLETGKGTQGLLGTLRKSFSELCVKRYWEPRLWPGKKAGKASLQQFKLRAVRGYLRPSQPRRSQNPQMAKFKQENASLTKMREWFSLQ